jgi:hypothetical protein
VIEIVEIIDTVLQGRTKPVLCKGADGNTYIVKGNYAGFQSLISEWIAGNLGRFLELPIPSFRLLKLNPQLLAYSAVPEAISLLGNGILFGSQQVPNCSEILQTNISAIDPDLRAKVLAFDWWIANSDRILVDHKGNPNLLWSPEDQKLVVIDHNLAFLPKEMNEFWETHAFRDDRAYWTPKLRSSLEEQFAHGLTQLDLLWRELPENWLEVEVEVTLETVRSLLSRFQNDANFWPVQ